MRQNWLSNRIFKSFETTSSITAAMPGTPSSISPGKSCLSHTATGPSTVTQSEDWYKGRVVPWVRALPMIPEDSLKVFGRAGLLAHSFMLGPNGDSNGCVSFKNYDAFLQAYLDHKIKRLAVVASL
jgi:hypothetical protein